LTLLAKGGSVTAFIKAIADATRRTDAKALVGLMQAASGEKPQMWGRSIIGFGSYHYKYESGREGDMPIIGFSPRKAASVLYGMFASDDCKALLPKLGKHTTGKGCLYIKKLTEVDQQVLRAIVVKSVAARREWWSKSADGVDTIPMQPRQNPGTENNAGTGCGSGPCSPSSTCQNGASAPTFAPRPDVV
jgi:hypothetical protein